MQSQNFEFFRKYNDSLATLGGLAEAVLYIDPGSALTRIRSFAEEFTKSIYKEERLPRVPQASFYEMTKDSVFKGCIDKRVIDQINYLRIQGNDSAHGGEGDLKTAFLCLGTVHQLSMYLAIRYYGIKREDIPDYVDIKDPTSELKSLKKSVSKYKDELKTKAEILAELLEQQDAADKKTFSKEPPPTPENSLDKMQQSQNTANSLQWDEEKTRAMLIDVMLHQAGWNVNDHKQVGIEFVVTHQDTPTGKGRADYVLWGENGQPLAVIEAKRSSQINLQAGREQARTYADSLVKMGYERPVIFYIRVLGVKPYI